MRECFFSSLVFLCSPLCRQPEEYWSGREADVDAEHSEGDGDRERERVFFRKSSTTGEDELLFFVSPPYHKNNQNRTSLT